MLKTSGVSPVRQAEAAPGFSAGPIMIPQDRGPNNPRQRTGGHRRFAAQRSRRSSVVPSPPLSGSVGLPKGIKRISILLQNELSTAGSG